MLNTTCCIHLSFSKTMIRNEFEYHVKKPRDIPFLYITGSLQGLNRQEHLELRSTILGVFNSYFSTVLLDDLLRYGKA